jgi:hypothetical protein
LERQTAQQQLNCLLLEKLLYSEHQHLNCLLLEKPLCSEQQQLDCLNNNS